MTDGVCSCSILSIIRDGRNVESGTLAELRHLRRTTIDAELAGDPPLLERPTVHDLAVDGRHVRCAVDDEGLDEVLRALAGAGVRHLTCTPPTLEELFLRHYDRS